VPLKPFEEALERCPPKLWHPNPKSWRVMLPKKSLNMLGTPKCEGQKPPLSLPETKLKKFHVKSCAKFAQN
jgi:hypothetical protein